MFASFEYNLLDDIFYRGYDFVGIALQSYLDKIFYVLN